MEKHEWQASVGRETWMDGERRLTSKDDESRKVVSTW